MSLLGMVALGLGGVAAGFVVWFLVRRPPLTWTMKMGLFFALFLLPTMAAMLGNYANLETTKTVTFCGQCHVMDSYVRDVEDPKSRTLAARHGHLEEYGETACYGCHADYGMLGGVTTKLGGMRHVVDFYSDDWKRPGHPPPELYKPYDTRRCRACHDPLKADAPLEHQVHAEKLRERSISCAAAGCHGPPHPAWKQVTSP